MANKEIVYFLIRAKKATYAGKGAETVSTRPKSHDLTYSEGEYMYYAHILAVRTLRERKPYG